MRDIKILKSLQKSKHDHFLSVNFDFYKRWKVIIKLILFFNKNYTQCEIFRKEYKFQKNIVIVGLKWGGKNVKRRTSGFAKEFIEHKDEPKCIYCEKILTNENATSDHIVPISKKGNNCQVNLMVCCKSCNNERGDMEFNEYLKTKNPKYKNVKYPFI